MCNDQMRLVVLSAASNMFLCDGKLEIFFVFKDFILFIYFFFAFECFACMYV